MQLLLGVRDVLLGDVQDGLRVAEQGHRAVVARTVRIPLTALASVTATNEWITEPFGLRHGGVVVSGLLKVGVWQTLSGVRQLLAIRRGEPTLRLTCVATPTTDFHEVLVGTADHLAGELQARGRR